MGLIWAPHVLENLKEQELTLYLEFSCSACIPSGACNVDRALQVLYQSNGDIKLALERLLANDTKNSINHDHAIWTEDERHCFERLIKFHGKNFSLISLSMRTKSVKECVLFYYLWKKSPLRNTLVSPRPTRATTTASIAPPTSSSSSSATTTSSNNPQLISAQSTIDHNNNSNSNNSTEENRDTSLDTKITNNIQSEFSLDPLLGQEQFPCKVCGRVFLKIKSRSAHMKRHKNER